jgi:hypothetical protein
MHPAWYSRRLEGSLSWWDSIKRSLLESEQVLESFTQVASLDLKYMAIANRSSICMHCILCIQYPRTTCELLAKFGKKWRMLQKIIS